MKQLLVTSMFCALFLMACRPEVKTFSKPVEPKMNTQQVQQGHKNEIQIIDTAPVKLIPVGEKKMRFYLMGSGIVSKNDIARVSVVGITHTSFQSQPGPAYEIEGAYNNFWDTYFEVTHKRPEETILALEMGKESAPNLELGKVYQMTEPFHFLTPSLFSKGVRSFIMTDPRGRSQDVYQMYADGIELFGKRGGVLSPRKVADDELPIIDIVKKPSFSAKDLAWLEQWKKICFSPEKQMEKNMYEATQIYNAVGVVGTIHALWIYRQFGNPVGIIATKTDIKNACIAVALQDFYLELLKKKK